MNELKKCQQLIWTCLFYSPILLDFLFQLLQKSVKTQQQVLQGKGFLVIGTLLEKADKAHITSNDYWQMV